MSIQKEEALKRHKEENGSLENPTEVKAERITITREKCRCPACGTVHIKKKVRG